MLRRLLVAGVAVATATAIQFALGEAASAASLGAPLGPGAGASAVAPDTGIATVTAPVTVRLLPGIQHSTRPRGAANRTGGAELGASGNGVDADPMGTCVSCTSAGAGSNSSSSESQGLHLADEAIAEGQSPTNGYASGEVVALPANPLLSLVVGRWNTGNKATRTASEAHSSATFASLGLGDGTPLSIAVFSARSDATSTSTGSRGSAASDGVTTRAANGQVVLILLHSDADSGGPGHVYVASLNDNEVMSSQELSGGVPITIPKVATISVLSVGPNGAVVGGISDGKSQQAAGLLTSSAG